jgi:NAD(P)-dependent dehydrogenase (short-subunit alcohol dehydrogenase family)
MPMPLLQNHIAVVTGAGSGIGRAIALGYAREGASIVLLDINEKTAAEAAEEIRGAGGKAQSFALDVTRREDCIAIAKQVAEKIGRVSILVNNAGINRRNAFTADPEAVLKDWQDIMAINLNGTFNVTHAFLEPLLASKGRIINIGSIQSFVHVRTPNSTAYTSSKHGVLGFTRALAAELGKHGVRVNAIGPGLIETPLNASVRANDPGLVKIFIDHTPLGRAGKPEDIVGPAVFLASDLSSYVTGSIVMADGGYRAI